MAWLRKNQLSIERRAAFCSTPCLLLSPGLLTCAISEAKHYSYVVQKREGTTLRASWVAEQIILARSLSGILPVGCSFHNDLPAVPSSEVKEKQLKQSNQEAKSRAMCSGFGLLVRATHGFLMATMPRAHVLSKLFGVKNDAGNQRSILSSTAAVHTELHWRLPLWNGPLLLVVQKSTSDFSRCGL